MEILEPENVVTEYFVTFKISCNAPPTRREYVGPVDYIVQNAPSVLEKLVMNEINVEVFHVGLTPPADNGPVDSESHK